MRERWFGATGQRVPEIAVEGELDVSDALVLDSAEDVETLGQAHARGVPVVVRASTPEAVREALTHPEVACVLVPAGHGDLLALDLTELTYG
ncbi:MAG: hypothetical protein ABR583_10455 [Gaiellaceae bacterium]